MEIAVYLLIVTTAVPIEHKAFKGASELKRRVIGIATVMVAAFIPVWWGDLTGLYLWGWILVGFGVAAIELLLIAPRDESKLSKLREGINERITEAVGEWRH